MGVSASCCCIARSEKDLCQNANDWKDVRPVSLSTKPAVDHTLREEIQLTANASRFSPFQFERVSSSLALWHLAALTPVALVSLSDRDFFGRNDCGGLILLCTIVIGLAIIYISSTACAIAKSGVDTQELACDVDVEGYQVLPEAGIVSWDVFESARLLWESASGSSTYALPVECAPLSREQAALYMSVSNAVSGMTFAELKRDFRRSVWLKAPDRYSARFREVVSFDPRDIVRVILSVSACRHANAAETASQWLQQIYALRFDHAMDQPKLHLDITPEELQKCRGIYPKAVYGLSKPHGYPIMWDMVSAMRLDKMRADFGTVEAALEKILWYDLQIMELFDRYKLRLSSSRDGVLLLKGISVIDLGAWASDLLYPAILQTVLRIIARSGSLWPESVWRIYLVNVPWIFMGPWSIIKKACCPVTVEKVRIYSSQPDFLRHLEQDLGVTLDEVPKEMGGRGPSLADLPLTPTAGLDEADNKGQALEKVI